MHRISSNMNNMNTQSALRLQESKLNRANNQISSQQKLLNLRDDPIAAGHLVRYQSYLGRVKNFEKMHFLFLMNLLYAKATCRTLWKSCREFVSLQ